MRGRKIWRVIAIVENFLGLLPEVPPEVIFHGAKYFALLFQYVVTFANCNKASIKKSSAHHNFGELSQAPLYLLKIDVLWGPSSL